MTSRIDFLRVSPRAVQAMMGLQNYVNTTVEHRLLALVKVRASQINGCAYCLDMHSKDARADGETEQRLYVLDAWREAPFYSERERAALEWTESLTLVRDGHVPDHVYAAVREHFSEAELADLALAVVAINGWNRLSIAFRAEAGSYRPRSVARAEFHCEVPLGERSDGLHEVNERIPNGRGRGTHEPIRELPESQAAMLRA